MKRLTSRLASLWNTLQAWAIWVFVMAAGSLALVYKFFADRPLLRISQILTFGYLAYTWHNLITNYDLSQLEGTPAFRYGVAFCFTLTLVCVLLAHALDRKSRKPQRRQPLPVDPSYPPTKMIFLKGETEERCACHGRVIEDGTEIWHWPQPAKLVCDQELPK